MLRQSVCLMLVVLALVCGGTGCTPENASQRTEKTKADSGVLTEAKKYELPAEPAGVQSVIDLRAKAKDGDSVVVAGQVGGAFKPFTDGRASFLMVDASLKPTAECDSPWDFCDLDKKALVAARVHVKFVDAQGQSLKASARELFGLKELSPVVIQGKVSRDDKDNVTILASGIFVRAEKK